MRLVNRTSVFFRRGRKPKRRRHTSDLEKGHHCTSACRGRHALSDDEDFIVHDTDEDSEDGDSGRVRKTCFVSRMGLAFSRNQKNLDELLLVNNLPNHSTGRRRPLLVPWAFLGHFQRRGRGHHRERRRGGGRRRQRAKEVKVKEQGESKT